MTAYEMRISDWSADVCSSDLRLQPAQRLLQRFVDVAPDRHHLADRFHRGREQRLGAFELLEREARNLGDDVIDRRLERGRGDAGDVVLDLVERRPEERRVGHACGNTCRYRWTPENQKKKKERIPTKQTYIHR